MAEICPTCGSSVRIVSDPEGEGTNHYEPIVLDTREREILEAGLTGLKVEADYLKVCATPTEDYEGWLAQRTALGDTYRKQTNLWRALSANLVAARAAGKGGCGE